MRLLIHRSAMLALAALLAGSAGCKHSGRLESFSEEQLATDPQANFRLGVQVLENPDRSGVIDYETAYRRFRDSAELGGGAKAHFNAAWVAEVLNKPEDAERHYGKAYAADNGYKPALYSYARLLTENGRAEQAVALFQSYLEAHPQDAEVRNQLVLALSSAKQYDAAEDQAQQILLHDPDDAQVYRNLSAMYYSKGDFGMSELTSEKALSLEKGDSGTYNNIGVTKLLQGDEPGAIDAFNTALKLDPSHFEANTNLGYIALNSGDFDLALKTLLRATETRPANAVAKLGLAVAYRGKKEFDKSENIYDGLMKANPGNQTVYFNAATLHEKYTRDYTKALKILEKFVSDSSGQIGPSHAVFARMEAVKASKAEEELRKAEEAERKRLEEERRRRNEELLQKMSQSISSFQSKIETHRSCLDDGVVEELGMMVEQAQMVIDADDVDMAPDIQSMLDDYYAPMLDEQIAGCGDEGGSDEGGSDEGDETETEGDETETEAPAEGEASEIED